MSAAAGRMLRIMGIALAAVLGATAAWPDADAGRDQIAQLSKRAFAREYSGIVMEKAPLVPVAAPAMRDAVQSAAGAQEHKPQTDAFRYPVPPSHPQIPQQPRQVSAAPPEQAIVPAAPPLAETPQPSESPNDFPATYVVTAYYLNVRAEPDKTSQIRGLLEQGDRVNVVGRTDNGWLELDNGLYIHGAYAEPANPEHERAKKTGREVTIASASASEAASVQTETAVYDAKKKEPAGGPAPLNKKVKSSSGLTEEDIAKLLEGTALAGHGLEEAILGIEEEYGINALFTIAVMKLESGNGKSKLAREKNNLFGLNATGGSNAKAYSFETKSDSVYKFGKLIAKSYVAKGYSTIEKVGKKYCPTNPKWASLVESIMKRDHRKLTRGAAV